MTQHLALSIGQYSDKGRKESNQDFHGAFAPNLPLLQTKGIAIAIADGISSSDLSHIASESAVSSFLNDYFCTSEAWTVKTSGQRVITATNSWLHSQSMQTEFRYDLNKGYVCTFSAMVVKSNTAHIFHAGDTRIYKILPDQLEQLTKDHRLTLSQSQSYLARALGIEEHIDVDYRSLPVAQGDLFLLATDGVYEFISLEDVQQAVMTHPLNLEAAAAQLVKTAYDNDSHDNLTAILQIGRAHV